jgi:spore germination protein YaaH
MKNITKVIVIVIVIVTVLLFASWIYLARIYPTTSPLKSGVYKMESLIKPHAKMKKKTFGFLAYWRLDEISEQRLDLLTEVNYFGLNIDGEGNIIKEVNGETDPGWREWNNQNVQDLIARTQIMGGNFSVTIISQNNDNINSILDNSKVQENLISNIVSEVSSRKLDGVNIDFEYLGEPDEEYKEKFTEFSNALKKKLVAQSPNAKLYLSIMPRSARDPDLFEFKELANIYDEFIGMSYDYSGISSDIATATAPLTGFDENKYFFDITTTYNDFLKTIPSNKILMGVPYYGWEWAVEEGRQIQSKTLTDDNSYAAVMSYERAKSSLYLKENQCQFDEYALQPWCFYKNMETGADHQVWFENEQSISAKYNFAIEKDLSGVAIWILGYDAGQPELWNLMGEKFAE